MPKSKPKPNPVDLAKYGKKGGDTTKALYGSEYYRIVGALGGQNSGDARRGKRRGGYRRSKVNDENVEPATNTGAQTTAPKSTNGKTKRRTKPGGVK